MIKPKVTKDQLNDNRKLDIEIAKRLGLNVIGYAVCFNNEDGYKVAWHVSDPSELWMCNAWYGGVYKHPDINMPQPSEEEMEYEESFIFNGYPIEELEPVKIYSDSIEECKELIDILKMKKLTVQIRHMPIGKVNCSIYAHGGDFDEKNLSDRTEDQETVAICKAFLDIVGGNHLA